MAAYVPGSFDVRAGIIGDLAYVDDTETVTVYQPGVATGFVVADVVREDVNVAYEDAGGASVPGTMTRFWLGFAACASEPLMTARIKDADGVYYRVESHTKSVMRLAYQVDCIREV